MAAGRHRHRVDYYHHTERINTMSYSYLRIKLYGCFCNMVARGINDRHLINLPLSMAGFPLCCRKTIKKVKLKKYKIRYFFYFAKYVFVADLYLIILNSLLNEKCL